MNGEIILGVLSGIVGFLSATGVVGVIRNFIIERKKFKNTYKQVLHNLEMERNLNADTTKRILDIMNRQEQLKGYDLSQEEIENIQKRYEECIKSMEDILEQCEDMKKKKDA